MLFSYYDLLRCFHTFFLISGQCPLFHCRRFPRFGLGSTKVCWTKFYAAALTVFSRSTFSQFAPQCRTQYFHEVKWHSDWYSGSNKRAGKGKSQNKLSSEEYYIYECHPINSENLFIIRVCIKFAFQKYYFRVAHLMAHITKHWKFLSDWWPLVA